VVLSPQFWLIVSSIADLLIASTLAIGGIAMTPLPAWIVAGTLAAAAVFASFGFGEGSGLSSSWDHLDAARRRKDEDEDHSKDFRVREGDEVDLKKWPTKVDPVYKSKEQYKKLLEEHVAQLSSLQQLLYASNRYAVLLIFQAMDAAGKDGAIKHVMSGVNPQGCQVFSFKHPSPTELQHDFLWRTTRDLPERGRIGIFNRSYYEEVLIVRVHPEILRSEGLPDAPHDDKAVWHDRYRSIVEFGETPPRQRNPHHQVLPPSLEGGAAKALPGAHRRAGKELEIQLADMPKRKFWKQYMKAYENASARQARATRPGMSFPPTTRRTPG
jgi:polyphosphate kinase 2 (PPK2 family)